MSQRVLQINELLKSEIANLVSRDIFLENGLITITYVDCSPDLKNAKIGISVLPEHLSGSALRLLRSHSKRFSQNLKKRINLKFIPKFTWEIDKQQRYANEIDRVIMDINQ